MANELLNALFKKLDDPNLGLRTLDLFALFALQGIINADTFTDHEYAAEQAYKYAKEKNKAVHFLGLVSDGGVHSSTKHLMKLCDIAKENDLKKVFIHICTDGRDTDPHSGKGYVEELQDHLMDYHFYPVQNQMELFLHFFQQLPVFPLQLVLLQNQLRKEADLLPEWPRL